MRQLVNFIFYSNFFIACCAVFFLFEGYLLLGYPFKIDALAGLVFFGALFIYLLIRIVAKDRISTYAPSNRWYYFLQHFGLMKLIAFLSLLMSIFFFFAVSQQVQIALLLPAIISVAYGLPFLGRAIKRNRLRDFGLIKIFLISFVWAYIGSVLPAINIGDSPFTSHCLTLYVAHFLFIFSITLPFDIKDLEIDQLNQVKTIPSVLGIENTYQIILLGLFSCAALHLIRSQNLENLTIQLGPTVSVSIMITGLIIYSIKGKTNHFLFFALLDGTIILQFLLVWVYTILHQ